jgi:hypothetical protein
MKKYKKNYRAWLAQYKEGGHALMFQYPERLSSIVNMFLKD